MRLISVCMLMVCAIACGGSSVEPSTPDASAIDGAVPDASVQEASVHDAAIEDASEVDASTAGDGAVRDGSAFGDGGTCPSHLPVNTCTKCVNQFCCAETVAEESPAAVNFNICLGKCAHNSACANRCASDFTDGLNALVAYQKCTSAACASQCASPPQVGLVHAAFGVAAIDWCFRSGGAMNGPVVGGTGLAYKSSVAATSMAAMKGAIDLYVIAAGASCTDPPIAALMGQTFTTDTPTQIALLGGKAPSIFVRPYSISPNKASLTFINAVPNSPPITATIQGTAGVTTFGIVWTGANLDPTNRWSTSTVGTVPFTLSGQSIASPYQSQFNAQLGFDALLFVVPPMDPLTSLETIRCQNGQCN